MEACEYGLTWGTCFVARRLDVVAVAGLLWFRGVFSVRRDLSRVLFSFKRTRPAASMKTPCLIYLYTSSVGG